MKLSKWSTAYHEGFLRNRRGILIALFTMTLVLPILLIGAVHPQTLALTMLPAAGLLLLLGTRGSVRLDLVTAILVGMVGLTVLQLIPLPPPVVELLSPSAFDLRAGAMKTIDQDLPRFMPLTLDATLTVMELSKLLVCLTMYWAAAHLTKHQDRTLILRLVAGVGVMAAAIFLTHRILLLDRVYGFYIPRHLTPSPTRISAPLLNENHMAGLLLLCTCVIAGLANAVSRRRERLPLILLAAMTGGTLLLTLSRGGITAFVMSMLFITVLLMIRRLQRRRGDIITGSQIAWIPVALAAALALGMFTAQDAIIGEFLQGDHRKIELGREAFPLLRQFPLTGVGRGAFVAVFPMVSDWTSTVTFTHVENVLIQVLVDYGLLAGTLVLLGFALLIIRRLLVIPERTQTVAVLAGLFGLLLHNLVDFNLEIPGVAIVGAVLLGTVMDSPASFLWPGKPPRRVPPAMPLFLSLFILLLAVVLFFRLPNQLPETEGQLAKQALENHDTRWFSPDHLNEVFSRHPADYYFPLIAGVHSFETGTRNPMPLLARAAVLNPHIGTPRLYIGRYLLMHGYLSQAILEMRLASQANPRMIRHAAAFLVNQEPLFENLRAFARNDTEKRTHYDALAQELLRQGHPNEARKADQILIALTPPAPSAVRREARRLAGEDRIDEAMALAGHLQSTDDGPTQKAMLKATILDMASRPEEAVSVLEKELPANGENIQFQYQLVNSYQNAGRFDDAIRQTQRIRSIARTVQQSAYAVEREGDIERRRGNLHTSIARYRQVAVMTPDNIRVLDKLLHLAMQVSDRPSALFAARRLHHLEPTNDRWREALTKLEGNHDRKPM